MMLFKIHFSESFFFCCEKKLMKFIHKVNMFYIDNLKVWVDHGIPKYFLWYWDQILSGGCFFFIISNGFHCIYVRSINPESWILPNFLKKGLYCSWFLWMLFFKTTFYKTLPHDCSWCTHASPSTQIITCYQCNLS